MLDANAIEKIVSLGAEVNEVEKHGATYTTKQLHRVKPPTPARLGTHTLTAVADYCEKFGSETDGLNIHVMSPGEVAVCSNLKKGDRTREVYLISELISKPFAFDCNHDAEQFVIAIQAQFVQDENTAAILKVAGNITSEAEQKTLDDGTTQTVTAKTGIAKVENVRVPNPVTLRPYRTFAEIEQPASKFVFRMKASNGDAPKCALYEADGGAWKNDAVNFIKKWLEENVPGVPVLA